MKLLRTASFLIVVVTALFLPLWAFALTALLYAFLFSPYELVILGVFLDAQFGDSSTGMWYWYTAISSSVLIVSTYLRPYLSFYTT